MVCLSATQVGKTFAYACKLLAEMWEYRGRHSWWWCAPTYRQSRAAQRVMYEIAESAGIRDRGPRPPFEQNPPPSLVLINGATCEYRTWDDPQNLMGDPVAGAVIDEAGLLTHGAQSAISTRRSYTLGPLWYIGNPGSTYGPFREITKRADESGRLHRWTWRTMHAWLEQTDPTRAAEYAAFIERERDVLDSREFRRLYEAEWIDFAALPVYASFERAVHVRDVELDPHLPLDLGCDFNVDPMCWVVGQHKGDEAWVVDEIVLPGGATTLDAGRELVRRYAQPKRSVTVYGDAAGKARSTRSHRTDYEILTDLLRESFLEVRFDVPAANPAVVDRVNVFNARLQSTSGVSRWSCHSRCTRLIDDCLRTSYRAGTRDIDKTSDRSLTHASDAEGYRLVRLYPSTSERPVFVPQPKPREHDPILDAAF